jgi:hypothetical protein
MTYTSDLFPILISLLFLSIVVLLVAIINRKNFLVVFTIIPLTLLSSTVIYFTVDRLLGYPVEVIIPDDSFYITHLESLDREWIYVWAVPPESGKPRAYTIANTEQNKKAMEEAEAGAEEGVGQQIGSMQEGLGQTEGGEYIVYDFIPPDTENLKNQ